MIKVGIIGAGHAAAAHARGITESGLGQVVRVFSPDATNARLALRYGARVAASAEELIEDEHISAIVIASPTDTHLPYLRMAAEGNKHVMCEVPVAHREEDLDDVQHRVDAAKTIMAASLPARHAPELAHLREVVNAGTLGQIGTIRLGCLRAFREGEGGWYADRSRSGGAALELLPGMLDTLAFCFGPVERVQLLSSAVADPRHDYVLAVARLADGAIAHLEASWTESAGVDATYYEVAGSAGLLEYDSRREPKLHFAAKATPSADSQPEGVGATRASFESGTPYVRLHREFLSAVVKGHALPASLRDAVSATRLALTSAAGIS